MEIPSPSQRTNEWNHVAASFERNVTLQLVALEGESDRSPPAWVLAVAVVSEALRLLGVAFATWQCAKNMIEARISSCIISVGAAWRPLIVVTDQGCLILLDVHITAIRRANGAINPSGGRRSGPT